VAPCRNENWFFFVVSKETKNPRFEVMGFWKDLVRILKVCSAGNPGGFPQQSASERISAPK